MEKKFNKKSNKSGKIILFVIAAICLIFIIKIGSCVYKIASDPQIAEVFKEGQASDAEIEEYKKFLDEKVDALRKETERYADALPEEAQALTFDSSLEGSEKYAVLYESKNWAELNEEEKKAGEAYLAYSKYYKALSDQEYFLNIMDVPKISKNLIKALMDNNEEYQRLVNPESSSLSENE